MKRLASILLLAILVFNWVGYRMLSSYLESRATAVLEIQLDHEVYSETELIEIRVPLDLPYQTNWKDFERFDGEVMLDGVHYKYVKRKVQDGQMVLLCIPNKERTNIQTARDDFFRLVNDLQHPGESGEGKSNKTTAAKNFTCEYFQQSNGWSFYPLNLQQPSLLQEYLALLMAGVHASPYQPPEAA